MARAPRASVSKTSGQGVSRLSYQQGYAMRGGSPKLKDEFKKGEKQREYGKGKGKTAKAKGPGFNVSYGDTIAIGDLKDIENYARRK